MRIIITLFLLVLCGIAHAKYNPYNSFSRRALVIYERGDRGIYKRTTEKMLDDVSGVKKNYAYDKKAQILYVLTYNANCAVSLTKDYAKIIKKDKSIPQLKGDELNAAISANTKFLDDKFMKINEQRLNFIQDSIAKVKADSIERVRKHERLIAEKKKAADNYRTTHKYQWLPTGGATLECTLCNTSFTKDTIWCFGIKNDSAYFTTVTNGDLGLDYQEFHAAKIPYEMKSNQGFLYHYEVFKDSLSNDSTDYRDLAQYLNFTEYTNYLSALKRRAPFGFVKQWSWDKDYDNVTLNMTYVNLNPKTIRYIDVYFRVTNDVGDVRLTGYFSGTGPLKQYESASWDWDNSHSYYYVAGDASRMRITKLVITWMNGKKQIVTGKNLQFQEDYEDSDD